MLTAPRQRLKASRSRLLVQQSLCWEPTPFSQGRQQNVGSAQPVGYDGLRVVQTSESRRQIFGALPSEVTYLR
jgi:hypothetical protein